MIAMLVGEENPIELGRADAAAFETDNDLARTQSAIDQNPTMIGRDERTISGAAAAEHRQTEHGPISSGEQCVQQQRIGLRGKLLFEQPTRSSHSVRPSSDHLRFECNYCATAN